VLRLLAYGLRKAWLAYDQRGSSWHGTDSGTDGIQDGQGENNASASRSHSVICIVLFYHCISLCCLFGVLNNDDNYHSRWSDDAPATTSVIRVARSR